MLNKTPTGNPVAEADVPYIWGARALMLGLFAFLCLLVHLAWKRKKKRGASTQHG